MLAHCLTSLPSIFDRIYNIFWNPDLKTDRTNNIILFCAKDLKQEYISKIIGNNVRQGFVDDEKADNIRSIIFIKVVINMTTVISKHFGTSIFMERFA